MNNYHDYEEFDLDGEHVEIVSASLKYGSGLKWTYRIDGVERGKSYSQKTLAKKSARNQILKGVLKQGMEI